MELFSYKGQYPKELPERINIDDKTTLTSLKEVSIDILNQYGFIGPIEEPVIDPEKQVLYWDEEKFVIIDKENQGEPVVDITQKNYVNFWNLFIESLVYKKIKENIYKTEDTTKFFGEFLDILFELRNDKLDLNIHKLGNKLKAMFFMLEFTEEEKIELQSILEETKLNDRYSLPNNSFIESHIYRVDVDYIQPVAESVQPVTEI